MILTRLAKELNNLSKYGDGELILQNHAVVWNFYLVRGQLLCAAGGFHSVRRWNRALEQHRPNWNWPIEFSQLSDTQPWECQVLERGLSQKQLSLIQAKLMIRNIFQECLFELISYTDFNSEWKPGQKAVSDLCRFVCLSANETQTVFNRATQMQQQWQAAGLGHLSPTVAPILQQGAHQGLPVVDKYLDGNSTLWDIAGRLESSLTEVASSLIPFVEKGILQFQEIPDMPIPTAKQSVAATPLLETQTPASTSKQLVATTRPPSETNQASIAQKQPVIACIDDSPVLAYTLRKILVPAGYQMLSISEPMRGFGQLIEYKPDLILLDLLLPNADGYSICKFLRETPAFKDTPIIILTARNTQIDRAHAQLVGATEFLGKPPQPQELLGMVHKYLSDRVERIA